jgi:hypothetical protein
MSLPSEAMETDTATGARTHLERLLAELTERGWTAEIGDRADRPILHVRNPRVPQLNEKIVCSGARYRWSWGADIGPVDDVREAADRVVFVLREIT